MVNQCNMKVFVNCGAGVSRSSTIWLAFVALFGLVSLADADESTNPGGIFTPFAVLNRDIEQMVDSLARILH
jgi:hypothetical protein